jgi:acyl-CoA synthetase (AMP-forming)/AMP-acid ligase II
MTAAAATLVDILGRHVAERPDARACVMLADRGGEEASLTFAELDRRARALAARIAAQAGPGERALLLFPTGIEFPVAFCACLFAGVVAVPVMPPRRQATRDASAAIVADCTPRLALTSAALLAGRGDLPERVGGGLAWLTVEDAAPAEFAGAAPGPDDIAFLQYTSGSTSAPKGVVVSHANLAANLAMIAAAFGNTARSTHASWLPLYHDMGLIMNLLQALYLGATAVLMSPVAFLQRPLAWLRAIAEYRAEVAGAPNFAYDLCVARYRAEAMAGVDLSGWRVAFNGAEPVRAETLRRFAETFAPHGFSAAALRPPRRTARRRAGSRSARWSAAVARSPASASPSSIPTALGGAARARSARSGWPDPMSRAATGALAPRRRRPSAGRSPARPRRAGCAPAISALSTSPASCSSPGGSRTSSSSAASTTTRRTSSTPPSGRTRPWPRMAAPPSPSPARPARKRWSSSTRWRAAGAAPPTPSGWPPASAKRWCATTTSPPMR